MVWVATTKGTVDLLAASDLISFGLVLHISNINELEHISNQERDWKTTHNGVSIVFIAVYSVLFCLTIIGSKSIDQIALNWCVAILSIISFILSFTIYHHLSIIAKISQTQTISTQ